MRNSFILIFIIVMVNSCGEAESSHMYLDNMCLNEKYSFQLIGIQYSEDGFDFEQMEVHRLSPEDHLKFVNNITDKDSSDCIEWESPTNRFIYGRKSTSTGLRMVVEYSIETHILTIWTVQL